MALNFLIMLGSLVLVSTVTMVLVRRDLKVLPPGAVFVAQIAYSTYVGGDAWEYLGGANRYVAIAMPLLVVLLATALESIARLARQAAPERITDRARGRILVFLTLASLASLNSSTTDLRTAAYDRLLLSRPASL